MIAIILVQAAIIYLLVGYINYVKRGSFYIVNFYAWPIGLLAQLITGVKNEPPWLTREVRLVELCRMAGVPEPLIATAGKPTPALSAADRLWAESVAKRWADRRPS